MVVLPVVVDNLQVDEAFVPLPCCLARRLRVLEQSVLVSDTGLQATSSLVNLVHVQPAKIIHQFEPTVRAGLLQWRINATL